MKAGGYSNVKKLDSTLDENLRKLLKDEINQHEKATRRSSQDELRSNTKLKEKKFD